MNEQKILRAGMGEWHVSTMPDLLQALGLGSCVGVFLFDEKKK